MWRFQCESDWKKFGRVFKKTVINEDKAGLLKEENTAKYDFLKENVYS